jgi:hypothetical protein
VGGSSPGATGCRRARQQCAPPATGVCWRRVLLPRRRAAQRRCRGGAAAVHAAAVHAAAVHAGAVHAAAVHAGAVHAAAVYAGAARRVRGGGCLAAGVCRAAHQVALRDDVHGLLWPVADHVVRARRLDALGEGAEANPQRRAQHVTLHAAQLAREGVCAGGGPCSAAGALLGGGVG